ncbi:MAG: glycosyltransferase family 4 protein [Chloroflexi bacterium]|nr:glycosyltransferase family 4 protein [Chloroflexota bacterium]
MTVPVRAAFVMEQSLGHVTHYRNLREFTDTQPDVTPVWLPIPFDVRGADRLMPVLRSNWSVRASWRALRALNNVHGPLHAIVFHTQVTSLLASNIMRRVPSLISLDATPMNYDTMGEHYGHRPAGDGLLDRRKYELNRRAFRAATRLVTWSDWARRSLVDDYGVDPARISVLAPGAGEAYFELGQRRAEAAPQIEHRRMRLLFVGGDFLRKGGFDLLASLDGHLGERCELHVVTQSDIPARPNVTVHRGLLPNSAELLRLYSEADVFVLPTRGDCHGLAVMEAAAAGLPVITTHVGGLSEVVQPGITGLVTPPGAVDDLRAALGALLSDTQRQVQMGRAGHLRACQKFNSRHNNRVLLDLVRDVAATRPGSRRAA